MGGTRGKFCRLNPGLQVGGAADEEKKENPDLKINEKGSQQDFRLGYISATFIKKSMKEGKSNI